MNARPDQRLVYVLGTGHSGSTLLCMLLNGHSQILGLGEVHKLRRFILHPRRESDNPLLKPLWQQVAACCERRAGVTLGEVDLADVGPHATPERLRAWTEANALVFSCAATVSGKRLLVDTSHDAGRLALLEASGLFDIRVICLVRDGRAVINSYVRKYRRFGRGLANWMRASWSARRGFDRTPRERRLRIRYEDLARDPPAALQRICAFLGVDYEPRMLAYRSHPYAGVSGNRMRRGGDETIALDQRWRREMPLAHRLAFAVAGGWLNKLNGY